MGKITVILSKELQKLFLNSIVLAAAALLILSAVLATMRSADAYYWNKRQYSQLSVPDENSPLANLYLKAAAEPRALQVLARGTSDILARPVQIMRHLEAPFNIKYSVGQDRRQRELIYAIIEDIDPAMALRLLLPIFALLLGFDAVCGEREQGTLRQVLANPVARRAVPAGKMLAGAITLLGIVALATLALLSALWSLDVPLGNDDILRMVAVMVAAYVYGFTFYALGLLVSTLVRTSDLSILISLSLWVLLVIVAPALASGVAEYLSPAPPAHRVYMQKLAVEREIKGGEVLDADAETVREANRRTLERISAIDNDYLNIVRNQERIAGLVGLLSPSTNFESIAFALAGTGLEEEHELMRQLNRHFRLVAESDDLERNLSAKSKLDVLQEFYYTPLSVSEAFFATAGRWAALLVSALALVTLTFVFFNRYDVR